MSIYSSYITPHYVTLQTLIQMPRIKMRADGKPIMNTTEDLNTRPGTFSGPSEDWNAGPGTFIWYPIDDEKDAGNVCSLWDCSTQAFVKRFNIHLNMNMYMCFQHSKADMNHEYLYTKQIIRESKITKEKNEHENLTRIEQQAYVQAEVKKYEEENEKEKEREKVKQENGEYVHGVLIPKYIERDDKNVEDKNVINPKYVGGNGTRVWDPLKHQCSLTCLNEAAYKCYDPKISTYMYLCSFHYNKNEGKKYGYTPLTNEDKEREDKNVIKPEYTVVNGIIVYDPELLCNFADCRTIAIYKRKDEKRLIYHKLCYYHHSTNNKINDIIQSDYETIKGQGDVVMDILTTEEEILIKADKRTKAKAKKNKHVNKKAQIITRSEKKKQKLEAEAETEMEEEQGDYDLDCAF